MFCISWPITCITDLYGVLKLLKMDSGNRIHWPLRTSNQMSQYENNTRFLDGNQVYQSSIEFTEP